jgi:hypothetical protein
VRCVGVPTTFALLGDDGDEWPVRVRLSWRPQDPHAVVVRFIQNRSRWLIARELLVDALTQDRAGEGVVLFWRLDDDECDCCVGLILAGSNCGAEFRVPREALIELIVLSEPGFRGAVDAWQVKWQGELTEVTS